MLAAERMFVYACVTAALACCRFNPRLQQAIAKVKATYDMNMVIVSPHQGVKLVLACAGSECYVTHKLTFINFFQGWIELFSAGV